MSSWSMNDGSALTGTMTFTNGNATVSGSGTNFDPQVKGVTSSFLPVGSNQE